MNFKVLKKAFDYVLPSLSLPKNKIEEVLFVLKGKLDGELFLTFSSYLFLEKPKKNNELEGHRPYLHAVLQAVSEFTGLDYWGEQHRKSINGKMREGIRTNCTSKEPWKGKLPEGVFFPPNTFKENYQLTGSIQSSAILFAEAKKEFAHTLPFDDMDKVLPKYEEEVEPVKKKKDTSGSSPYWDLVQYASGRAEAAKRNYSENHGILGYRSTQDSGYEIILALVAFSIKWESEKGRYFPHFWQPHLFKFKENDQLEQWKETLLQLSKCVLAISTALPLLDYEDLSVE